MISRLMIALAVVPPVLILTAQGTISVSTATVLLLGLLFLLTMSKVAARLAGLAFPLAGLVFFAWHASGGDKDAFSSLLIGGCGRFLGLQA